MRCVTLPSNVALTGKKLTEDCKKELAEFKIDRGTNVNKNVPLGEPSCAFVPVHEVFLYNRDWMLNFPFSLQLRPAKQTPRRFVQTLIQQTLELSLPAYGAHLVYWKCMKTP